MEGDEVLAVRQKLVDLRFIPLVVLVEERLDPESLLESESKQRHRDFGWTRKRRCTNSPTRDASKQKSESEYGLVRMSHRA